MIALPIDPALPEIVAKLGARPSLVLEAPPGAGKTTRVPRALLEAGFADRGEIVVLEPRRLAARLAAERVAEELGERLGDRVGYTVRFDDISSDRTRVRFVTEGVLTRRATRDPELRGVAAVVLDEIHERALQADLALALMRAVQRTSRPDLRIVAMSATLDAEPVARFLGADTVRAEGRRFEVAVEHLERSDDRPLEKQVASAVRRLVDEGLDGDVLVFLPGALEIRRAMEACTGVAKLADLLVLPLHGSLPFADQQRAVRRADKRKVILSTNVAETSVTIDGVVAVVDTGLARVASTSPWSGLPSLKLSKVSKASATQRAGRAGRTRAGSCLRLFTKGDFDARPDYEAPEIRRVDFAPTALDLAVMGAERARAIEWLEPPQPAHVAAARELLERLGALDDRGAVTATGRDMQRLPLHPRLARVAIEAARRGAAREGATLAALLSERMVAARRRADSVHRSDALALLDLFELSPRDLDPMRVQAVKRARDHVLRNLDTASPPSKNQHHRSDEEVDLELALLTGYPDRVGRLRRPAHATGRSAREVVFAAGGAGALGEESGVDGVDLLVAIDVEERDGAGRSGKVTVRMASAVEADWLLELYTDRVRDETALRWNAASERVEAARELAYDGLVLESSRATPPQPAAGMLLFDHAKAAGARAFLDADAWDKLRARAGFVERSAPDAGISLAELDRGLEEALRAACEGAASFAELRQADLLGAARSTLGTALRALDELAPASLTLPGGRRVRIEYPSDAPPFAESRLQDFFGMRDGPRLVKGRVPLVLHLLAPNHRAVQVTTDLAGFWERHYPGIAKELRRKYPRHAWPDDPLRAAPPAPRR